MKTQLHFLFTLFFINALQGKEALVRERGNRAYFAGSNLDYFFKKNKNNFPQECTIISWGVEVEKKTAATGRLAAKNEINMHFKLPELKAGVITKGHFLIHLENDKGEILNSLSYPLWILSKEDLFSECQETLFYTENTQKDWVEVLKGWGVKGKSVQSLKGLNPTRLIAWDLNLEGKNGLGAELMEFVRNGGEVLILGSINGDISLGIKGPNEISLKRGGIIEEEVKGFDFKNQQVLNHWLLVSENGEFLLKGVRGKGKVDQGEGYIRVDMKNGKGRLSLCSFQLNNSINNDPSILLLIRNFLTGEDKR